MVRELTRAERVAQRERVLAAEIRDPRGWAEKPVPRTARRAA